MLRGFRDSVTAPDERGEVAARLTWRLTQHVEESGLGTVSVGGARFRLPGRTQAPALVFVHAGAPKDAQPDMVVEFTSSPGHVAAVAGWLSAGVGAVLSIDPLGRTVYVHQGKEVRTLGEADYLELPGVVPGWSLRVGDLFQ